MPTEPIISVSGLRGVVGESLHPLNAIQYVCAFAEQLPAGPIVVSRDGRTTGPFLAAALASGLVAVGRRVIDAGVAATPTTGILVRQLRAAGGIQISASHNPPQYNGLKLFSAAGRVIPAADGEKVIAAYRAGSPRWVPYSSIGESERLSETCAEHWRLIAPTVNVEAIRRQKFKVLLDSNHGAGSVLGLFLLRELGCEVVALGATPDGHFEHTPEPTAENLASVLATVPAQGCVVGFCQDPDADRLALIDERGNYIGEEYTLAICADHVLRHSKGPVVTNCSTSKMTEDLARQYQVPFFRSAVGEANVVDLMLQKNAVLGGEGNGGVIDPRVGLVRDSFVGMALVLDAMAARKLPVSKLAAELPQYAMEKTKLELARENIPAALKKLQSHFSSAQPDRLDGLRLDWTDRWLLVRASNTEPIVRTVAEAPTRADAQQLCAQANAVMSGS